MIVVLTLLLIYAIVQTTKFRLQWKMKKFKVFNEGVFLIINFI